MGQIIIRYPDSKQQLLSDNIDLVFPGRLSEDPIPNKLAWAQQKIEYMVKQRFIQAMRQETTVEEIEFGNEV